MQKEVEDKIRKMKNDFATLCVIFLICTIIIMSVLPINIKWGIVAFILVVISAVLQEYYDKHFKNNP